MGIMLGIIWELHLGLYACDVGKLHGVGTTQGLRRGYQDAAGITTKILSLL